MNISLMIEVAAGVAVGSLLPTAILIHSFRNTVAWLVQRQLVQEQARLDAKNEEEEAARQVNGDLVAYADLYDCSVDQHDFEIRRQFARQVMRFDKWRERVETLIGSFHSPDDPAQAEAARQTWWNDPNHMYHARAEYLYRNRHLSYINWGPDWEKRWDDGEYNPFVLCQRFIGAKTRTPNGDEICLYGNGPNGSDIEIDVKIPVAHVFEALSHRLVAERQLALCRMAIHAEQACHQPHLENLVHYEETVPVLERSVEIFQKDLDKQCRLSRAALERIVVA